MQEKMKKALADAISEVMETMFFLCPEPVGSSGRRAGNGVCTKEVIVHIQTSDEMPYRILLRLSEPLLQRMAGNLFERPGEGFTREELEDVACELANIVAGGLLNRVDVSRRRRLSIPEVLTTCVGRLEEWLQYLSEVEGEPFKAYLYCSDAAHEVAA